MVTVDAGQGVTALMGCTGCAICLQTKRSVYHARWMEQKEHSSPWGAPIYVRGDAELVSGSQ